MPEASGPLAGAGSPRRREEERPFARRARSWLVWWALLMSLWVVLDYSLALAELLVGAGVAAVGAFLTELVADQAASHFRMRMRWLVPVLALPGRVARDTVIVFGALFRQLVQGAEPTGGFSAVTTAWGDESARGRTRRALLVAGTSMAPNTLVLGIDRERAVMVVHHLVPPGGVRQRQDARR
ncbi:MAG: Na+/H+ antiporter subunit E [Pseudonocardiales bacterium]|nr:Na+/H+ antiporter subunit E [Pseudonocardiales bacterium]MBV9029086.1 Na+/H+ antiporter subunit E [Pseudonocardiales bacterium]MBW0009903.1 Na+/H+ antiporter subunit E [Pseudonocardiales bacterium]